MAAVVGLAPAHERVGVVGEPVDPVAHRPDAGLVDPAAEVGRGADVGRDGDHALGDLGRLAHQVDEEAPERLLGRGGALVLAPEVVRDGGAALPAGSPRAAPAAGRRSRTAPPRASRRRTPPTGPRGRRRASAASCSYCSAVEQRRVVGGVALGRELPALDRVREHRRRAVADGIGLPVAVEQRAEVVAAEVAERVQQLVVLEVVGDDLEPPPQLGRVGAQQALVLLVGHRVDAPAQRLVGGELRPVLDHHAVPARGLEHRGEAAGGDVGHDAIERLAVEVDDPHHLAEARDHRVGDRLPARALVELGVAEQRDLAAADRDVEVPGHVAVRERAPDRRRRPDPDRAGRVVDRVGVLGARRVATAARRTGAASPGSAARAGRAGS